MEIDVIALPIVPIHDSIKVCSGHITTLSPVYNASNIAWSPAKYLNSIKSSQPLCTPASTQEYTVTAYNRLGCSASGAVTVIVPQNTGQRLARDTTVCPESSITLRSVDVNTDTETQYTWLPGPGLDYSSGPEAMISASTLSHIYKVLVSKSNCIIDTEEITVSVASAANVVLPRSIMAVPDIEITLSPVSGNLTSYSWSATDTPSCRECSNPLITPQKSQYVYLHGANSYGCQITDSMYIHVSDCDPRSIFVPNTFTPNNDGQNDNLYVRSKTLSHLEYVRIYNRWGAIVYESKDINEGWDGTIAGLPSPQGVYVYQVSGRCKSGYEITTSGTVTIVR
jgi:gliding motility-associated-like protein